MAAPDSRPDDDVLHTAVAAALALSLDEAEVEESDAGRGEEPPPLVEVSDGERAIRGGTG